MTEWKKILFYAIIPALIAGIFAVAPKIYDEFTVPKAILSYQIIKGPILNNSSGNTVIYSINTKNEGKKPLNDIYILLKTPNNIKEASLNDNTGIKTQVSKSQHEYSASVETLHPEESFNISLMLATDQSQPQLELILRSKEVLGVNKDINQLQQKKSTDIIGGLFSGLSVFVMAMLFLSRGINIPFFHIMSGKPNLLFHIVNRLGFSDITEKYDVDSFASSYLRFGDMLFVMVK